MTTAQRILVMVAVCGGLTIPAAAAGAAANPSGTGQPSQSCQSLPAAPPGFSTDGFNHATLVYAGSAPQNSNNPASVSQYDVACYQVSQHH